MIYSQNKLFFYKIAYLTSTFDPVTFTLGELQNIVDINHMYKYHQYLSTHSWFINKSRLMLTHSHMDTQTDLQTQGHTDGHWVRRTALLIELLLVSERDSKHSPTLSLFLSPPLSLSLSLSIALFLFVPFLSLYLSILSFFPPLKHYHSLSLPLPLSLFPLSLCIYCPLKRAQLSDSHMWSVAQW